MLKTGNFPPKKLSLWFPNGLGRSFRWAFSEREFTVLHLRLLRLLKRPAWLVQLRRIAALVQLNWFSSDAEILLHRAAKTHPTCSLCFTPGVQPDRGARTTCFHKSSYLSCILLHLASVEGGRRPAKTARMARPAF